MSPSSSWRKRMYCMAWSPDNTWRPLVKSICRSAHRSVYFMSFSTSTSMPPIASIICPNDVGPTGKAERPGEWPCRARWSADDGAARECAGVGDRVQVQSHSGPQHHDRERGEEPAPGSPPATPQCPQVLEWCGRTPGKLAPH